MAERMMRVPHLMFFIETGGVGGAEKYLMELLAYSPEIADRVTLCLTDLPGNEPIANAAREVGAEVVPVGPAAVGVREALRLFARHRPSLVHFSCLGPSGSMGSIAAAVLLGQRFIVTEHTVPDHQGGGWKFQCYRRIAGWRAGAYIAVSQSDAANLVRYHQVPPEKVRVIYNGIPDHFFERDETLRERYRAVLCESEEELLVVSVAHLVEHKDPFLAIDAFAALPARVRDRSRLLLVGNGPLRDAVAQHIRVRGMDERIQLLGQRDDVHEILQAADVFLLTSRREAFSLAIAEAMAVGLPVVTVSRGGPTELVVHEETGFIDAGGGVDFVASHLADLAASASKRQCFGAAGRDRAHREFRLRKTLCRTRSVYMEVLGEGPDAAQGRRTPPH